MNSKPLSTFDEEMQNPSFKKKHEKEYRKFILSELLLALMANNHKSVRGLAKECGISSAVINRIRTGKQDDIKLSNFMNITEKCGFELFLEKEGEKIPLTLELLEQNNNPPRTPAVRKSATAVAKRKTTSHPRKTG